MTRGKRIAVVLGGVVIALGLLALAQSYGLGAGYTLDDDLADAKREDRLAALQREPVKLRPWDDYKDVLARPLFNETRAPELVEVSASPGTEAETAPLNVALTGVIITRDLKIAMVKDNESGKTVRVRVGQPLEGSQSGWKLVELKPRGAVFDGDSLGRQELELVVDTKGAPAVAEQAPAQPVVAMPVDPNAGQVAANAAIAQPVPTGQPANAEEIRRRIEERRKQLREEAQRMLEQQNSGQQQNEKQ